MAKDPHDGYNAKIFLAWIVWTTESNDAPAQGGNSCPFQSPAFPTTKPAAGQKKKFINSTAETTIYYLLTMNWLSKWDQDTYG